MELTEDDIQPQLTRRRPGQSKLTTPRNESDIVSILSGTEAGRTLGTPIGLFVPNKDQRPGDYKEMSQIPRPGHADYTYQVGDVVRNTAHHALHQGEIRDARVKRRRSVICPRNYRSSGCRRYRREVASAGV